MPLATRKLGRISTAAVLIGLVAATTGCGDGKIKRYPVTGSVLVGGKPAEGARVVFIPVGGSEKFQKERPTGVADGAGQFTLTTFEKDDGAPAGEYKVMVLGSSRSRRKRGDEEEAASNPLRIDRKYAKASDSGLTATVAAEPTTLPPFDLEPVSTRRRR